MNIVGVPFDFTLVATSENRQTPYQFGYDVATDTWKP